MVCMFGRMRGKRLFRLRSHRGKNGVGDRIAEWIADLFPDCLLFHKRSQANKDRQIQAIV